MGTSIRKGDEYFVSAKMYGETRSGGSFEPDSAWWQHRYGSTRSSSPENRKSNGEKPGNHVTCFENGREISAKNKRKCNISKYKQKSDNSYKKRNDPGKKAGKASIKIRSKNAKKCNVRLQVRVYGKFTKAKKVSVKPKQLLLKAGEERKITVSLSPKKATVKKVIWKSSDKKIANVDKTGKITAKKAGNVKVTAYAADGRGAKAVCSVTVAEKGKEEETTPAVHSTNPEPQPTGSATQNPKTQNPQTKEPQPQESDRVVLADETQCLSLYVDGKAKDSEGIQLVAKSFAEDVALVSESGQKPQIITENPKSEGTMLIAGSVGNNELIDSLAAQGKIDISDISGKRECYRIQVVEQPTEQIERAIVVAGSDKRGTIYGIYHISELIGVSPWVYWGDATPEKKSTITLSSADLTVTSKEPSVKYRGIFLNDEAPSLTGWVNVYTLGMHGESDSALGGSVEDNINLLKNVILTQKNILTENALSDAPQVLTVYKEVEDYWYGTEETAGLKDWSELDDVTIMLCDDNFGNMRTLPTGEDIKRPGGWGMYYHFDYHGGPTSYEWVNTVELGKVWEQMTMAYEHGIDDIWIVNVGDLKPMEMNISYFLDLAYDYDAWGEKGESKIEQYRAQWVRQQFGRSMSEDTVQEITSLLKEYTWLNGSCKPEVLYNGTYYGSNYPIDEAVASAITDGDRITNAMQAEIGSSSDKSRHSVTIKMDQKQSVDTVRVITSQAEECAEPGSGSIPDLDMTSEKAQYSYRVLYQDEAGTWKEIGTTVKSGSGYSKVFNEFTLKQPVQTDAVKIEIYTSYWVRLVECEIAKSHKFSPFASE